MSTADASSASTTDTSLSDRRIIAFSTTGLGKALFWSAADVFCLVFATDTLGIEPALAGGVILLTLIWDAVSDPIGGMLVDRFPRFNKSYGVTIAASAPMAALFLVLAFTAQFTDGAWQFPVFLTALLLFRTAFTFFDIPDNALFSRIARDSRSRIFGASARKLMATLAAVCISFAASWAFSETAGLNEGTRILIVVCIVAPVGSAALILGAQSVRRWDRREPLATDPPWPRLSLLARNPAVLSLATHMFLSSLGISIFMTSLIYQARFILGDNGWFVIANTTFLIAQAAGVFGWSWYASKRTADAGLLLAGIVSTLALVGFLSAPSPTIAIIGCCVFGFCVGGLNTLRWALAPVAIERAEAEMGHKSEASIMALFTLSIKSAIGLASLVVGAALSLAGYQPDAIASDIQATTFRAFISSVAVLALVAACLAVLPQFQRRECGS
jgi:glycoside/pentoside/hexuronide:cation symporter, GPH family